MNILIDGPSEKEKWKKAQERELIICSSLTVLFLIGLVLGIIYSPEDYLLLQILLIALTSAFIWLSIYEVSVRMKNISAYCRFYSSFNQETAGLERLTYLGVKKEEAVKDGIRSKLLSFSFTEKGKTYHRDIYLLKGEFNLKEGSQIEAEVFYSVLISYKEISL